MDYSQIKDTTTRLTLWRRANPSPQKDKWPKPYTPTPTEQATLDAISDPVARLTAYRILRDKAQQEDIHG